MTTSTKQKAMGAIALLAATQCTSNLIGWTTLEQMYDAVVHHRRWHRRIARFFGFEI